MGNGTESDKSKVAVAAEQSIFLNNRDQDWLVPLNQMLSPDQASRHPREGDIDERYIDWTADDSYTRTLKTISQGIIADVTQSAPAQDEHIRTLQTLYHKNHWTGQDRVAWEKNLSQAVSDRAQYHSDLGNYRIRMESDVHVSHRLNGLAGDIDAHTEKQAFCCLEMSATEGAILQMAENNLLGAKASKTMQPSTYYLMGGEALNPQNGANTRHAWITSSITANSIDFTLRPEGHMKPGSVACYVENADPKMRFADIVHGATVFTHPRPNSAFLYKAGGDPGDLPAMQAAFAASTTGQDHHRLGGFGAVFALCAHYASRNEDNMEHALSFIHHFARGTLNYIAQLPEQLVDSDAVKKGVAAINSALTEKTKFEYLIPMPDSWRHAPQPAPVPPKSAP